MKKKKIVIILIIVSIINLINVNKVYAFSKELVCPLVECNLVVAAATPANQDTPDGIMQSAKDFVSRGEALTDIDEDALGNTSDFLYNLLLGIGIVVAVIVGIFLGIKYMMGSVDEQADIKQMLIPYVIGCFVVFGAFGIWKIAVNILLNM